MSTHFFQDAQYSVIIDVILSEYDKLKNDQNRNRQLWVGIAGKCCVLNVIELIYYARFLVHCIIYAVYYVMQYAVCLKAPLVPERLQSLILLESSSINKSSNIGIVL